MTQQACVAAASQLSLVMNFNLIGRRALEAAVLTNYTLRLERHSEIIQVMSNYAPPLPPRVPTVQRGAGFDSFQDALR